MPYIPFGVECKNQDCHTGIILGDVWVQDQPLRQGDRIEFIVLRPTNLRCRDCQREYEYTQADLRRFPDAGTGFAKPAPRALTLPLAFPEPESEVKTDGKDSTTQLAATKTKPEPDAKGKSDAAATAEGDQLKAPSTVQGSDSGRAQSEAAREAETKKTLDDYGKKVGS